MSHGQFEQAWQFFARTVLTGLGPRELKAARVVFYAGGAAVFAYVTSGVASLDGDAACKALDAMQEELDSFTMEPAWWAALAKDSPPREDH